MKNEPLTPAEASRLILEAHGRKRTKLAAYTRECEKALDGARKNARNRSNLEDNLRRAKDSLKSQEEFLHLLDEFDCVVEDYEIVNAEIARLCEKRRELCKSQLIQAIYNSTKASGFCSDC